MYHIAGLRAVRVFTSCIYFLTCELGSNMGETHTETTQTIFLMTNGNIVKLLKLI